MYSSLHFTEFCYEDKLSFAFSNWFIKTEATHGPNMISFLSKCIVLLIYQYILSKLKMFQLYYRSVTSKQRSLCEHTITEFEQYKAPYSRLLLHWAVLVARMDE